MQADSQTVSEIGHPGTPDDPEASLRAALLGQIVAAQFELEGAVAELAGNGNALSRTQAQLTVLAALRRQIGNAGAASLATMGTEIGAAVAQTQTILQQGRASAASGEAGLASITAKSRQTVENLADELFRKNVFERYLQFASDDDERAYRRREAERDAYIQAELAKGTPEGAVNAADAVIAQTKDAGAHGATASPDFERILTTAQNTRDSQQAAIDRERATSPATSREATIDTADGLDATAATLRAAGVSTLNKLASTGHGLAERQISAANQTVSVRGA